MRLPRSPASGCQNPCTICSAGKLGKSPDTRWSCICSYRGGQAVCRLWLAPKISRPPPATLRVSLVRVTLEYDPRRPDAPDRVRSAHRAAQASRKPSNERCGSRLTRRSCRRHLQILFIDPCRWRARRLSLQCVLVHNAAARSHQPWGGHHLQLSSSAVHQSRQYCPLIQLLNELQSITACSAIGGSAAEIPFCCKKIALLASERPPCC